MPGDESRIGDIQLELAILTGFAHLKCIFTHEQHRLETDVLNYDLAAHFTPVIDAERSLRAERPPACPRPSRGSCGRASFTSSARPFMSVPFNSSIARSASFCDPNSTKPNPRERPPSRSQITRTDVTTNPLLLNTCCNSSLVTSDERFPTYSFVIRFPLSWNFFPKVNRAPKIPAAFIAPGSKFFFHC